MLRIGITLLMLTATAVQATKDIGYYVHDDNEAAINQCIEKVIDTLKDSTCLSFSSVENADADVSIQQSTHCAWQKDNKTIHLSPDCITDDICFELLGRALDVEQPRGHITRHLNVQYNCTDRCTIDCLHGGSIEETNCTCICPYGLEGDRCQSLSREQLFTDTSCGFIDATEKGEGIIQLSTYPHGRPRNTFCKWLVKSNDPWTVIDADIEVLGLDNVNISPGTVCNDILNIYGTEKNGPVPCDSNMNHTQHLHSTGNTLLIELRTNPYSENSFTGPMIKYRTRKVQPGVRIFSEGMSASSRTIAFSALVLAVVRYF